MATEEPAARPETETVETRSSSSTRSAAVDSASPLLFLKSMGHALGRLFGNWRALVVLLLLYGLMLASLYFFIAVREASLWQVLLTFLLAALVPVLFFIIQVIGVRYVDEGAGAKALLRSGLRDFWKLLVVSLPLLLMVWLIAYVFSKLQVGAAPAVAAAGAAARTAASGGEAGAGLFSWKEVIITTLRFLLLGLVMPLVAIQFWIEAAREGLAQAFKNAGRVLGRALAPGAVLVYAIGLLFFGVIPYFLITINYSRGGAWTEISLLGARLLLASLFMLCGWLITTGALSRMRDEG
ncbi:MAG TPA: hypothetical protein VF544_17095 [Pyrinomonadaceae bacterium]|jgi:hypothetical protein